MKNYFKVYTLFIIILSIGCEDVEVAVPGNNQNPESVAPIGTIIWDVNNVVVADDKARLPENSATGVTIGRLNATDDNPDDEFTFQIKSQKVDGSNVDHFVIEQDSDSNYDLETNSNLINYEALSGSKEIIVTITVTDDNPDQKTSDFDLTIEITNVNESPYFTNLNHIARFADEYVEYSGYRVEWSDTDEGDNPTFTSSSVPDWLTIESDGQMLGDPEHADIGNHSFILSISDGEIDVQEEINIEVRENLAPLFTNANTVPTLIRVGCYDDNENLADINWYDPNNNKPHFAGNDVVTFSHEGTESIEWLNFDNIDEGILFCVRAPENGDAGTSIIGLSLTDNRPNIPLTTEYSLELTLSANDAPAFTNLDNISFTISAGEPFEEDINWQDPQEDQITFYITESLSWFNWDESGNISATPDSTDIGNYNITFSIDDGCFEVNAEKTITVQ
ncbi:MAG: cadherin repeat domain-containing protein [bacterium TMED46]|nr:MAG: cadherin repeat domain-containing protein [bacterium TMED46]